jgi:hypothetical protein
MRPLDAIEQRDRALQKLQDLTWAIFLWAAGMVAVFSVIAAATLPGQTQGTNNTAAGTDSSATSASTFTDDGQLRAPAGGTVQAGGGSPPLVVTGGSH